MLKLFKVSFQRNHSTSDIVKYIKSDKKSKAIIEGMPLDDNGIELNIDGIKVEILCDADAILHCR